MKQIQRHDHVDAGTAPSDASSSGVVAVPGIPSASVVGFISILRDEGVWSRVRAGVLELDPFAPHWIDQISEHSMCPLDRACALMQAAEPVVGAARLREIGALRFARATDTGLLAPMLRSWGRAFVGDAGTVIRLSPHLWRGATQGLGSVEVLEQRPGFARLAFSTDHPSFVRCHAWHNYLAGWVGGLLAMRHGDNDPVAGPTEDRVTVRSHEGRVELELEWT